MHSFLIRQTSIFLGTALGSIITTPSATIVIAVDPSHIDSWRITRCGNGGARSPVIGHRRLGPFSCFARDLVRDGGGGRVTVEKTLWPLRTTMYSSFFEAMTWPVSGGLAAPEARPYRLEPTDESVGSHISCRRSSNPHTHLVRLASGAELGHNKPETGPKGFARFHLDRQESDSSPEYPPETSESPCRSNP